MNKFESMSDSELGVIAKDFMDCEKHKDCGDCACAGVLCGVDDIDKVRKYFISAFAARVNA